MDEPRVFFARVVDEPMVFFAGGEPAGGEPMVFFDAGLAAGEPCRAPNRAPLLNRGLLRGEPRGD